MLEHAALDVDARIAQCLRATFGGRAGIGDRVDHARDAGLDQRQSAWRGAAVVIAGLERDNGGSATGPLTGGTQGVDLGVRLTRPLVPTLTDDSLVAVEHDTADDRVRARGPEAATGKLDRPPHRLDLAVAGHQP